MTCVHCEEKPFIMCVTVLHEWCIRVICIAYRHIPEHQRIAAVRGSVIDYKYGVKSRRRFPAVLLVMDRFKCDLHTAIQRHMNWLSRWTTCCQNHEPLVILAPDLYWSQSVCQTNLHQFLELLISLNCWRVLVIYTLCPKKGSHLWDRFSEFFHQLICEKILYIHTQWLPPYLQYVDTLPCESGKSRNVTDFGSILNKLLTCWWGHFTLDLTLDSS